jgi:two-component system response regulator RegA
MTGLKPLSHYTKSTSDLPSLLLVDDDEVFCSVLEKAMIKRGFNVMCAHSVEQALECTKTFLPEYAIIDLRLPGASGLVLVEKLKAMDSGTRIIMLTGYASITTAVEAIKLGAIHYLAKPVDADEIMMSFGRIEGNPSAKVNTKSLSVGQFEWEYIQRILLENNGNVSATAKKLNMHRRTLQRKLSKSPH